MRYCVSLLALLACLSAAAQTDPPEPVFGAPQINHEAEAGYRDSVARHEDFGAIWHYKPHRCKNRYGRYGWVDKYHKVVIPFDYQEFPEHLSGFNPAKKGGGFGAVDAKGKVVIPFKYSSLSPYYEQRLVVCRDASYKITVFDFEGRVLIPEEKLYNIWLFNDSTLAVQDFSKKDVKIYNLQGKHIKTWPYSHILQFPSGRFRAYRDTLIGFDRVTLHGVLDPDGKVLVPLEYTGIEWEKGDWARVANYKTKTGGLFQISTQTLYPDQYRQVLPPDPLGNFTLWEVNSSGQARAGLMDAQFKVIFPPAYFDVRFLDEKGHYTLHAGPSNRGDRRGVGNAEGQVVMDTVLVGFKPMVHERKIGQNDRGQWMIAYDTLPFLIFEDILSGKYGLWRRQTGQLRAAVFDRFDGVSPTAYIQEKGDTSWLFHIDDRPLAGPYYRIWRGRIDDYLLVRPNRNDEYILLDLKGRFIRKLEGEPRRLADGIYAMGRYGNKKSGYGQVKEYGLFDRDLNPITGLVFDAEPHAMDGLNTQQKIRVLDREHPAGYGPWVGYMREGLDQTLILLDSTGKTYEIKPD
jgi:hypothetical protein